MRVISGTLGGRRLAPVPGHRTRPTTDRVREALFSRLDSRYGLAGARVLDLFAGTGALGIEALSRGARRLVCVESDRRAQDVLTDNLEVLGLRARTRVLGCDFRKAVAKLEERGEVFDGVLADPPYGKGLATAVLERLASSRLLADDAWVVLETGRDEELPAHAGALVKVREDRYGDTKLVLYERERGEESA